MRSVLGKISGITILLVTIIFSLIIIKQIAIVKAQNEQSITGYEIANITNNGTGNSNSSAESNEIFSTFTSTSLNDSEIVDENLENAGNETDIPLLNDLNASVGTVDSIDSSANDTNETSVVENETPIVENNTTINEGSKFDINLEYPQKITRGELITVKAIVNNIGSSIAKNVVINWQLPEGFEIASGNSREFCGDLEPSNACVSEVSLKTDISASLGLNDIKIVVNYEE
jgi:hypothetical protein